MPSQEAGITTPDRPAASLPPAVSRPVECDAAFAMLTGTGRTGDGHRTRHPHQMKPVSARKKRLEAVVTDDSGSITAVWFKRLSFSGNS
jgi:hypothetical protein